MSFDLQAYMHKYLKSQLHGHIANIVLYRLEDRYNGRKEEYYMLASTVFKAKIVGKALWAHWLFCANANWTNSTFFVSIDYWASALRIQISRI